MTDRLIGCCGFCCGSCPTLLSGGCAGCLEEHAPGDCFTRDCVLEKGLPFCGACPEFPCETIQTKERCTVLDKDWLRWKRDTRQELRIVPVTEETLPLAGRIHSESWQESHRAFCTEAFLLRHSVEAQTGYLRREVLEGKRLYMLLTPEPVGIVSVLGSLIENLYILPRYQRQGYGTRLLRFAMAHCDGEPTLWILDNNEGARRLYHRHGFRETGRSNALNDWLSEIEMRRPWGNLK